MRQQRNALEECVHPVCGVMNVELIQDVQVATIGNVKWLS